MTIFNAYENEDNIYIGLGENLFLYVGKYNPFHFSDEAESDDPKDRFTPYSRKMTERLHIIEGNKFFKRMEKVDGIEIDIDSKYEKSIIKKTLGGYNA